MSLKTQQKSPAYFVLVLLFLLQGCSNLQTLAGVNGLDLWSFIRTGANTKGYVDAVGGNARFEKIIAIAVDKDENVYVADQGNASIRKIDPQGRVTTLAGSNTPQETFNAVDPLKTQFVDLKGLTLWHQTLYFTVRGCIRMIDLNHPEEEMRIQTFYGKCLNANQAEPLNQTYLDNNEVPEYLHSLGELRHDVHGNLYVAALTNQFDELRRVSPDSEWFEAFIDRQFQHKITPKKQLSLFLTGDGNHFTNLIGGSISLLGFVIDSQSCVVELLKSFPPASAWYREQFMDTDCRKEKEPALLGLKDSASTDERFKDTELQGIWMGAQDDLYVLGEWLAKLSPEGDLELISEFPYSRPMNSKLLSINPAETTLYFAEDTVVYKWKFRP